MHIIRKDQLPLIGSSYNFVGAHQGDVAISMFLVEAKPGRGALCTGMSTMKSYWSRKANHGSLLATRFERQHPVTSSW